MKKALIILALYFVAISLSATSPLTIDECVRLAREHYPAIAQYGLLDKVKQLNLSNASKTWLPQGSVSAQISWQNKVSEFPDALADILASHGVKYSGLNHTQYSVGVDISQQIWDGGRTSANRQLIKSAAAIERGTIDLMMYDVGERIEEIFFSILMFDNRIITTDKSILLVNSALQQVKSMYRNGTAMQSDCDQIEANLLELNQQKAHLIASRHSFQHILEIFIGEKLEDRELVKPTENDIILNNGSHPQMYLYDLRLDNIDKKRNLVKSSLMPEVKAFVSGYYGYPGYNLFKNMQSRELSFNFVAGIKIAWNFGTLYTRNNSLNLLQNQRKMIETDRETFIFNNNIATNESLSQIIKIREIMRSDKKIVELRHSVMSAAQSKLNNGVIDVTEFLSKVTDMEIAENDAELHGIELIKAIYQLNRIQNK